MQGHSIFETTDGGETWAPRNKGLRADWPLENPEVGYCVHKLVLSPTDDDRMYQQNHVGMHRSDDAGQSWVEITEGLPTEFGFAAAVHPHDRDSFYVIPLDPGHTRCMPDGEAACGAQRDAGSTWQRLDRGLPQHDAYVGVLREGMAIDSLDSPGLYFGTSTGQVFASADEATAGTRSRATCRASPRSRWRWSTDRGRRLSALDAAPALPRPRTPRGGRGGDVQEAIDRLDERWPGFATGSASPATASAATSTSTSTVNGRRWTRPSASRRAWT